MTDQVAPRRVVLVDDSVPVRTTLRQLLQEEGFEIVWEAGNGAEGLALLAAESPDAVVLDLAMPGLDGLKAIPRIREQAPDVKIVVMSLAGRSMQADALEAGAHAYFGKAEPLQHVVLGLKSLLGSE